MRGMGGGGGAGGPYMLAGCSSPLPDGATERPALRSVPRTRRFWKPNSQYVNLYSNALGRRVRVRVTTAALR